MGFYELIRKELEMEKAFMKQYQSGMDSLKSYSNYRLCEKRLRRYYLVDRRTKHEKSLSGEKFVYVRNMRKYKLCETGVRVLERNLKALERLIDVYRPYDPSALEETLSPAYRAKQDELNLMRTVQPVRSGHRFTQSENPYHPEHLIHITSFGLIVRSRIEAAAAELAYNAGYYIMYEKRVILYDEEGNSYVVYPDFILCDNEDSSDVNWIYWEHLGLLDMEEYRERTMLKLKLFPQNGIIPGRNLILTTDGMHQSIDLMAIKNVLDTVPELQALQQKRRNT